MPLHVAKRAVAVVFLLNGFAYASWLSRIPTIRDRLELSRRVWASCSSACPWARWPFR